jgi:hypothetical protein
MKSLANPSPRGIKKTHTALNVSMIDYISPLSFCFCCVGEKHRAKDIFSWLTRLEVVVCHFKLVDTGLCFLERVQFTLRFPVTTFLP